MNIFECIIYLFKQIEILPSKYTSNIRPTIIFSFHINCINNKFAIFFHDFCFSFVALLLTFFFSLNCSFRCCCCASIFHCIYISGMRGYKGSRFIHIRFVWYVWLCRLSIAIDLIIVIHICVCIVWIDANWYPFDILTVFLCQLFLVCMRGVRDKRFIYRMLRTNVCRFILIKVQISTSTAFTAILYTLHVLKLHSGIEKKRETKCENEMERIARWLSAEQLNLSPDSLDNRHLLSHFDFYIAIKFYMAKIIYYIKWCRFVFGRLVAAAALWAMPTTHSWNLSI